MLHELKYGLMSGMVNQSHLECAREITAFVCNECDVVK